MRVYEGFGRELVAYSIKRFLGKHRTLEKVIQSVNPTSLAGLLLEIDGFSFHPPQTSFPPNTETKEPRYRDMNPRNAFYSQKFTTKATVEEKKEVVVGSASQESVQEEDEPSALSVITYPKKAGELMKKGAKPSSGWKPRFCEITRRHTVRYSEVGSVDERGEVNLIESQVALVEGQDNLENVFGVTDKKSGRQFLFQVGC